MVIVCQPGDWCCKGDGWPLYVFFPVLMGGRLFLKDDFHTDES